MPLVARSPVPSKAAPQSRPPWPSNEERNAPWLAPEYRAHRWYVSDSTGEIKDVVELNFEMPMPDGRTLVEWPEFHFVVSEVAFHARDIRYTRIDDAEYHVSVVSCLMTICHALALQGFTSFNQVYLADWKRLLPKFKHGTESLMNISARVEKFLKERDRTPRDGFVEGLPTRDRRYLNTSALMKMIGLPASCGRQSHISHIVNSEARALGLLVKTVPAPMRPQVSQISEVQAVRYFQAIEFLWIMRRHLGDYGLPEKAFSDDASTLANRYGLKPKPTPVPPPHIALHLLSQAMLWVANYSGPLLNLLARAQEASPDKLDDIIEDMPRDGPAGCPWPIGNAVRSRGALSAHKAVLFLAIACFIIIAGFSARRLDEIWALRASDFEGSDNEGWWLYSYIQKTLLRRDWIAVPPVVARAMEVLCKISATARVLSGDEQVFQWLSPFRNAGDPSNLLDEDLLDEFAAHVQTPVPALANGEEGPPWHWTPHQFRKFFAVLYFYRFRGATIEVLSQFLRHFNLEMTRAYLTLDPEVKKFYEAEEAGYRKHVARGVASRRVVHGGMTKSLLKAAAAYRARLAGNVRMVDPNIEDEAEYLERQMKRKKLVLTPKPWVDCSCPPTKTAATQARCQKISGIPLTSESRGPDFAHAGPLICSECPHSIDNGRLEQSLRAESKSFRMVAASAAQSGSLFEGMLNVKVIEIHRVETVLSQASAG